jgi:hypothetical protein
VEELRLQRPEVRALARTAIVGVQVSRLATEVSAASSCKSCSPLGRGHFGIELIRCELYGRYAPTSGELEKTDPLDSEKSSTGSRGNATQAVQLQDRGFAGTRRSLFERFRINVGFDCHPDICSLHLTEHYHRPVRSREPPEAWPAPGLAIGSRDAHSIRAPGMGAEQKVMDARHELSKAKSFGDPDGGNPSPKARA